MLGGEICFNLDSPCETWTVYQSSFEFSISGHFLLSFNYLSMSPLTHWGCYVCVGIVYPLCGAIMLISPRVLYLRASQTLVCGLSLLQVLMLCLIVLMEVATLCGMCIRGCFTRFMVQAVLSVFSWTYAILYNRFLSFFIPLGFCPGPLIGISDFVFRII